MTWPGVPYDPVGAARLLDAAGWRYEGHPGSGVRHRGGRPLAFTILVPASSATRTGAAVLLQQMFARVGARVGITRLDHATMVADLQQGDFDAALNALTLDPDPAAVRDAWGGQAARDGEGFNFGGYASPSVDSLLAAAGRATDAADARRRYARAYCQIVDDAPAVFLYEPLGLVAYDARWRPAGVRPDAWWAGLPAWRLH
jgi:peptide/nickel transport system substrate-binding protein